jgi:hypothetical protein
MTSPQTVNVTPVEAADLLRAELILASEALHSQNLDTASDHYVRALGLGLQLGPAPTEQALTVILQTAQKLAQWQDARGLSLLGPALIDLVAQVQEAGALPPTMIMEAWATIAADLGTLIGQIGLALTIPSDHRKAMLENARTRAVLLDDATGNLFALTAWVDELHPGH